MVGKIKTEKDYYNLANREDAIAEWLGPMCKAQQKTWWLCVCGQEFQRRYNTIDQNGSKGCNDCTLESILSKRRLKGKDYHKLANRTDAIAEWLGPLPNNTKDKTWWRCVCGSKMYRTYQSINQNGSAGCDDCAKEQIRQSHLRPKQDYHDLAKSIKHISEWLGPFPENTHTKTWWRCATCGNEFDRTYKSIATQGSYGCKTCSDLIRTSWKRKSEQDYIELAENDIGLSEFLGPYPQNTTIKTWWLCKCGRKFKRDYDKVLQVKINRCRHCSKSISSAEVMIADFLETNGIDFDDQKSFEGCHYQYSLFFDFFLPDYNLLIEYNGEQHYNYKPTHFHKEGYHKFEEQQERDAIKAQWAAENGYTLIVIPYTEKDRIEEILTSYLA